MSFAQEPSLSIEYVSTKSLVPYANNAKIHSEIQVEQIANSIRQFKMCDPIAVWTNPDGRLEIVEGHGRLLALDKLGVDVAPVIKLDHLSDEERRAYTHVHNQTTLTSGFDEDILSGELESLDFDWEDFGFDWDDSAFDVGINDVHEVDIPDDVESICASGDVWVLGEHRLMCGDSTNSSDVSILMDGNRADVCFTSPPYNLVNSKQGGWNRGTLPHKAMRGGIAYDEFCDDLSDDDYSNLLCDALSNALGFCDDAMFNVGILAQSKIGICEMMHRFENKLCDILVWNKSVSLPMALRDQYGIVSHRCELIFCFNNRGVRAFSHPQWDKGTMINRIDTGNASSNKYAKEHAATFPVEFAAEIVSNFTETSVLDLFGGTGTTLIAAEQLGRKCYMMELSPHYCDIIIARWEGFTGKSAVRVECDGGHDGAS